jgi:hypothetical protein
MDNGHLPNKAAEMSKAQRPLPDLIAAGLAVLAAVA